jgi:hypothetical protein
MKEDRLTNRYKNCVAEEFYWYQGGLVRLSISQKEMLDVIEPLLRSNQDLWYVMHCIMPYGPDGNPGMHFSNMTSGDGIGQKTVDKIFKAVVEALDKKTLGT